MEAPEKEILEEKIVPEAEAQKKPYAKPEIIYRAPLESMAAVCLPRPPGKATPSCRTQHS